MKLFRFKNIGKGRTEGGVVYYYRWWFFRNKGYCRDGVKKTLYKDPYSNESHICTYRLDGSMVGRAEYKGGRLISKASYNRKGGFQHTQYYDNDGILSFETFYTKESNPTKFQFYDEGLLRNVDWEKGEGKFEVSVHLDTSGGKCPFISVEDCNNKEVEPIPFWIRIKVCLKLFIIHRGLKFVWI